MQTASSRCGVNGLLLQRRNCKIGHDGKLQNCLKSALDSSLQPSACFVLDPQFDNNSEELSDLIQCLGPVAESKGGGRAIIQHNATASGAAATRRAVVSDGDRGGSSLQREVVWPVNSAGSSLTFRGAVKSLSPSKVEERQSPASKRVNGAAFYWESGDRLSFRPPDRSESVSRLESSAERGRSLDRYAMFQVS